MAGEIPQPFLTELPSDMKFIQRREKKRLVEKIYGKVRSIAEFNQIAAKLRQIGMKEELQKLAEQFHVPKEQVQAFLERKRYFLVDGGNTGKVYSSAKEKLVDEMLCLNDPMFGNIIGNYLISRSGEEPLCSQILLPYKTLQRCIEYLMEQAYSLVSDEVKNSRQNTALAVAGDQVLKWAGDYYSLDDKDKVQEETEKADKKFRQEPEVKKAPGKTGSTAKSRASKKSTARKTKGKANTETAPGNTGLNDIPAEKAKSGNQKTKETDGQLSLFGEELTA